MECEVDDWNEVNRLEDETGLAQAEARSDEVVNGIDERTPEPERA